MTIEFDKDGSPIIPVRKTEISQKLNELIEKAMEYNSEDYKKALKELEEFQRIFPIEKIKDLTLEKYCHGFKNSFCWWVEEGTIDVVHTGHDGFNREYGIWFSDKEKQYYKKEGVRKIKIDEETAKVKLEDIKIAIISVINLAKDGKFDEIEEERELWHQVKAKIVYLYFPEKTLPILSKDHLKSICDDFGLIHYGDKRHLKTSHELMSTLKQIDPFKTGTH